ncbi:MAG: ABC transporter ATP-binding protein [Spirochaetaceae bacterium]|nr:MAG: ABC transporter ATP-binding protein [Spirochaetaceae bacterium]
MNRTSEPTAPSASTHDPSSTSPIISVNHVRFGYDAAAAPVLRDLCLDLPGGVVTALLGPNGCGKTTLLNLCLGWLQPQAGSISLGGRPLTGIARRDMGRALSLVPQDEHVPFEYSVLEYVLLGRAPHLGTLQIPDRSHVRAAEQALEAVGALEWADRSVNTISAGEKQLVMAARSLAQEPSVLLMDEPSSHLDPANTARLLDLIRRLSARGVTVVFTTHDPGLAAAAAHTVALMRAGEILFCGPADDAITSERLSATYGVPMEVHVVPGGRRLVTWQTRS